jgi:hypothetical protein
MYYNKQKHAIKFYWWILNLKFTKLEFKILINNYIYFKTSNMSTFDREDYLHLT